MRMRHGTSRCRHPSPSRRSSDTPIVRVTTRRLRERLEAHYARYDAPPKLRIVLPKGRYAPEFVAMDTAVPAATGIAVLPARNQSGVTRVELPLASFAEVLTDQLARAGLPRVLAHGSVAAAQASVPDATRLGEVLGLRYLLEPSLVQEADGSFRASVRLLDAADGNVRWVETLVGGEASELLDRLLALVVRHTLDTLPAGVSASRAAPGGYLPLAHAQREAYDEIRFLLLRRTVPAAQEALERARRLALEHAEVAEAWAMLAAALYSRQSFHDIPHRPLLEELRAANARALALDPEQPVALRTQGIVLGRADHDGAKALRRKLQTRHPYLPPARFAEISACLRERVETLRLLRQAQARQDLALLHTAISPALDWLAEDRELLALLNKSGVWRAWRQRPAQDRP